MDKIIDIHELLNRFELLLDDEPLFSDLRRAFIDGDRNSLYRVMQFISHSQLIESVRKLESDPKFDRDCISQGQIKSKKWLIDSLKKLNLNLGTVFLCAGWYATLATMIFESDILVEKIRSFDIDDTCRDIAEIFNKPWVLNDWEFKTATYDIMDVNYTTFTYNVYRSDGSICELTDSPDTIINTSCEHIKDFNIWYSKIPRGKLVILQTNNYFEIEDHINCSKNILEFAEQTPMTNCLYQGALELPKYTRYMRIGYK